MESTYDVIQVTITCHMPIKFPMIKKIGHEHTILSLMLDNEKSFTRMHCLYREIVVNNSKPITVIFNRLSFQCEPVVTYI